MGALKSLLTKFLPHSWYQALVLPYHFALTLIGALRYGFPAKKLTVIGVTGTKGKSSVSDMLYAALKESGYAVAVASTIRFAIKDASEPNLFKMTLPGRGFIQKFLSRAAAAGCTHAVVEITSEATRNFRHKFLYLDALVFTNLQKEHIESHGSYEKYANAKLQIAAELARSPKRPRAIIANADDPASGPYLALPIEKKFPFSYSDAKGVVLSPGRASFSFDGVPFSMRLPGSFSVMNALAVARVAQFLGVPLPQVARALSSLERIPGRTERIEEGQDFVAVVDYAHTPDSLKALYGAYPGRKICVLGNTGGGRDSWKRPEMGRIADESCTEVILTDEDPYDEEPREIVDAMAKGMKRSPRIILDRREAIREAIRLALELSKSSLRQAQGSPHQSGVSVLITGKGTDPYIMKAKGEKVPWSDAQVVREELKKLLS
jgi:UDP-N-acetylmuramoyl-L-alanyl-D-glutamate--2,6-diaminopimelate ligase